MELNPQSQVLRLGTAAAVALLQVARGDKVAAQTLTAARGNRTRAVVVRVTGVVTLKTATPLTVAQAAQALTLFVTKAHRDLPAALSLRLVAIRFIGSPHQAS
jgi:hypothetical protein